MFEKYLRRFSKKAMLKYMKKIGVNLLSDDVDVDGSVRFDTEPYLITLNEKVKITSDVRFVTHDGGVHVLRNLHNKPYDKFGKIVVGKNVFIGNKATIMPGVTIGNNVIIGFGSIVTHDIPDNEIWAGVPAKRIESIDEYYNKNKDSFMLTKNMSPEEKRAAIIKQFDIKS